MRQSFFIFLLMVAAGVGGYAVYYFLLPEFIRLGGPLVGFLVTLSILEVTFVFERVFTLNHSRGRGFLPNFLKRVYQALLGGDLPSAIGLCQEQRGSCANILRAGIEKYQAVQNDDVPTERRLTEVQRAMEEANALEVPLLERNLIALSTIASISTMVGLLGTTIGMIRSFRALGHTGQIDAVQLAIGISEALINTAGGLAIAIAGIVAYNYFVNRVDNFNYTIDEASYQVIQILTEREVEQHARR